MDKEEWREDEDEQGLSNPNDFLPYSDENTLWLAGASQLPSLSATTMELASTQCHYV